MSSPTLDWWRDAEALRRFVCDLLGAELARGRPGRPLPDRPWPAELAIDAGGLDADSLELLSLATALNQALHLHESGVEDYLLARRTLADWCEIAAAGLERRAARVTFMTSGSSGRPRPCTHALDLLGQEIEALVALFGDRRRILAAVPSHHIYGFLFTQLLPRRLALPVLDLNRRSPLALAGLLRPGDLLIGFPDYWRLAAATLTEPPSDIVGVSSTAPLPAETAAALGAAGLRCLFEIYGSSETAGVGWRQSPEDPFRLHHFWRRSEDGRTLLRRLPDGGEAAFALPDRLDWQDDIQFRPAGRRDGMVQVGGVNVDPVAIAAILRQHPQVADAAVRLMRPEEGHRLKAFIVPDGAVDLRSLRDSLARWSEQRLTPPERPKAFSFGAILPAGPMGKAMDWPTA